MQEENDGRSRATGGAVEHAYAIGFDRIDGGRRHISVRGLTHENTSAVSRTTLVRVANGRMTRRRTFPPMS
jgi:hypothetical protein